MVFVLTGFVLSASMPFSVPASRHPPFLSVERMAITVETLPKRAHASLCTQPNVFRHSVNVCAMHMEKRWQRQLALLKPEWRLK